MLFLALLPAALGFTADERADRVFINGNVWTGNAAEPRAEAIAVRATRIIAVGTTAAVRKRAEKLTEVVDLKGRLVVPGFNDAEGEEERYLPAYERLMAEGGLQLRFAAALPMQRRASAADLARYDELRARYHGPRFRFGAVKGFVDGVVDARTAAMLQPYTSGGNGILNWTPEDLPRFKALGVVASTQALFANPDQTVQRLLKATVLLTVLGGQDSFRHPEFQR